MRDVSKTLSDFSDLLRVEWGFLLPSGGGERVEIFARRRPVSLCLVDPLGDDGWVGSRFEGCLVAGESSLETRDLALPPALTNTPLAKRPYDLRHSALSTWLCAGADPAEVAQRARNSVEVLLSRYAKCLHDRQPINNQHIEGPLSAYDQPPVSDQ